MKRIALVFLAASAFAQTVAFPGPGMPASSGGGTALVNQISATFGGSGGTTSAIDTTGANFLVMVVTANGVTGVSDSKGNSWMSLTTYTSGSTAGGRIYYVQNPTVGAGHTFTVSGAAAWPGVSVAAFSGMQTSSVFDAGTDAGFSQGTQPVQTGGITPPLGNHLVITGVAGASTIGVYSVSPPFLVASQGPAGGSGYTTGLAYCVDTTGLAVDPAWSSVPAGWLTTNIASFKGM